MESGVGPGRDHESWSETTSDTVPTVVIAPATAKAVLGIFAPPV